MNFKIFGTAVAKQFQAMTATGLFVVDVDKDKLWETYLGSFPEGTNPIYQKRTEHDCSCCRSFVRHLGGVVSIVDNKVATVWDVKNQEPGYQAVADAMAKLVRSGKIVDVFFHVEKVVGAVVTRQLLEDRSVKTWDHFSCNLPNEVVMKGELIGTRRGELHATHDVMYRGLAEITMDALDTTLDLISQNSLYRGSESKGAIEAFRNLKVDFDKVSDDLRDNFVWARIRSIGEGLARLRNTAMGTFLTNLSEGFELEDSVKEFERIMAPANYKRPTALVTKGMIAKAQETVNELGLASALERRYATISDITVNNILFVDRSSKPRLEGAAGVFDELAAASTEKSGKKLDKVEEVTIDHFIENILPRIETMEIMVENSHQPNFVSLIGPSDPTSAPLFKWPNRFSWSYTGEVADSIKERVKKAGGSIVGDLMCRLAWEGTDDLDAHMIEPDKFEIYFGNRRRKSPSHGELDLDANGADGIQPHPAENIFYTERKRMKEGVYKYFVHNFARRSGCKGFTVEIEFDGQIHSIEYAKAVPNNAIVQVAQIEYSRANGFKILESLPSTAMSKMVWGVPTQVFRKVNVMMLSPNHWDGKEVGNKHYFFMLDGCKNEGRARGFYNEFLTQELDQHRKVLEMVGSKMKTEESDEQLSGVGFSSTQRNSLLCRVKGSFSRTVKINF